MVMEGAAGRSARSAVVVGGGVGGLSTAIRLKLSGQFDRVRILEKNDRLGGRVKTLMLESSTSSSSVYRFDTGPSLLLFPEEYMRTFEELGCELPEMKPVGSVGYRCFFNRGVRGGQGKAAAQRGEEKGNRPTPWTFCWRTTRWQPSWRALRKGRGRPIRG